MRRFRSLVGAVGGSVLRSVPRVVGPAEDYANYLGGNVYQRALVRGDSYEASLLSNLPVLRSLEPYGTYRAPRQFRCWKGDGIDDYAVSSSNIGITGAAPRTMCFRAKLASTGDQAFVSWGTAAAGGFFNAIVLFGNWYFNGAGATDWNTGVAADTNWHHHTVVYDGTNLAWYIDGVSIGQVARTLNTVDSQLYVLQRSNGNYPSSASIYDIRVYNVAKSLSEIQAIYAGDYEDPDRTGLVAGYWCNEESGTLGYDWSGNGRHLTLTNITQATFHAADTGVTWNANNVHGFAAYRFAATDTPKAVNVSGYNDAFVYTLPLVVGVLYKVTINVSAWTSGNLTPRLGTSGVSLDTLVANPDGTGLPIAITGAGTHIGYIRFRSGALSNLSARTENANTICTISGITLEAMEPAAPFIPANFSSPGNAADGNALTATGQAPYPVATESVCLTGDGSSVYADLGSALIPASADFELSFWYYPLAGTDNHRIIQQSLFGIVKSADGQTLKINRNGNVTTTLAVGSSWTKITLSRVGDLFTLSSSANSGTISVTQSLSVGIANTTIFASAFPGEARIADLRITTGGHTTYFPLQDGPGTANLNRNLAWYKSDGTYGVVNNAIVNGTVSNIWANRCPRVRDWCIENGGRLGTNGQFILGAPDSNLCADGNTKTLTAGKHGNPYSRLNTNPFTAAELNGRSMPTALAPGGSIAGITPSDSAFIRSAADGDDRLLITKDALTGSALTKAQAWVS